MHSEKGILTDDECVDSFDDDSFGLPTGYDYDVFIRDVKAMLSSKANAKGYHPGGPDSENAIYVFTRDYLGGHAHSHGLGEVVYKLVRYRNKGSREDLLKAAAWLFLILRYEGEGGKR